MHINKKIKKTHAEILAKNIAMIRSSKEYDYLLPFIAPLMQHFKAYWQAKNEKKDIKTEATTDQIEDFLSIINDVHENEIITSFSCDVTTKKMSCDGFCLPTNLESTLNTMKNTSSKNKNKLQWEEYWLRLFPFGCGGGIMYFLYKYYQKHKATRHQTDQ